MVSGSKVFGKVASRVESFSVPPAEHANVFSSLNDEPWQAIMTKSNSDRDKGPKGGENV